tara:strand:+ start:317 stop:556 length:240 start_codon:yes stop_codon:yes gene_type:complete
MNIIKEEYKKGKIENMKINTQLLVSTNGIYHFKRLLKDIEKQHRDKETEKTQPISFKMLDTELESIRTKLSNNIIRDRT